MTRSNAVRSFRLLSALAILSCAAACGTDGASPAEEVGAPANPNEPAAPSKPATPDETVTARAKPSEPAAPSKPAGPNEMVAAADQVSAALRQALTWAENTTRESLAERYPAPAPIPPSYDATAASGMDLIGASSLALSASELSLLKANGFVISKTQAFPSFAYGYKNIYADDLPVYISADSILEAVHRTFDSLLKQTEQQVLIASLNDLLSGMRANLVGAFDDPQLTADADLYLSVATALLNGQAPTPIDAANQQIASEIFALASAAEGHQEISLFGVDRDEDFSQFKPRGHYSGVPELEQYFKAMMWLGRVDLRLIETQGDGSQVFYRRQFDAAVALRQLMAEPEQSLWQQMDAVIGTFVGEHDSMTPEDMGGLMDALGVNSLSESAGLTDEQIIEEIASNGWGAQRIASRIIRKHPNVKETLPLDRSFLLFGQRYTVDSHTFVNVTFDRVEDRMMPNPLDAAFAALGNNAALPILEPEFDNGSYVTGLAKTRTLVDAHEPAYWEGSLYTHWLGALRSLSVNDSAEQSGVPQTQAWQSRMLSTQLASWAELRHDTILYAKQSYTAGVACEFPDAYVDPYPEFYARLGALAEAVAQMARTLPTRAALLKSTTEAWAMNFKAVTSKLQLMAENQLTGAPHSQNLLDFINDAVNWDEDPGCGGPKSYSNLTGWYLKLYLDDQMGLEYDPTVADVHTQPTDEFGNDVGHVLHVGTGMPRLMVVTAETCSGPRAYAGLAFSYGELITEDWERLDDDEWSERIDQGFPDVPWMSEVIAE